MKCYVISNCTHAPIREYLAATGVFSEVASDAIFTIAPEDLDARYADVRKYDLVLSTVLFGDKWGPFEHKAMKADLGDRCLLFDAPFFEGLHPDLIHVALGAEQERFKSPIGDYHSGLIFWGWMKGIPIEEIIARYTEGDLPAVFNPRASWDKSLEVLRQRETLVEVRSADRLAEICREHPAMLTFNHPTMPVVAATCDAFLSLAVGGNAAVPIDPTNIYNVLLSDVVIPVSPAAIRANDLGYRSSPAFKFGLAAPNHQSGYLDFARFARLSYARYSCVERDALMPTTPGPLANALKEDLGLAA